MRVIILLCINNDDVNLKANVIGGKRFCVGRPRALRLSANWKRLRPHHRGSFPTNMTVESVEPVKIFHHTPLLKISHQKGLSHGYYLMGGHEISTSRSLEMIGKISLVMWLHFNQSYSNNLSMWEIIYKYTKLWERIVGIIHLRRTGIFLFFRGAKPRGKIEKLPVLRRCVISTILSK